MRIANASPTFIEYHALQGSYGRVTYFVTKTTLRDAAENLSLAPQDTLTFSERIQRVVNIRRVEREIVPYLETNDLRFFNALVCILLPDSNDAAGCWDFEEYKDEAGNPIGGIGKLRIIKDVGRVVLDGQHRFVALQQYWKSKRENPAAKDAQIDVAIVFVMVDSLGKIGSSTAKLRDKTILAVRNLFAVLNKTARSVDKSTLLLIDDSDIFNVMTRSLLESKKINELFVKWTSGENLQPKDVYFSTLNVIKDAVSFYLRDFDDDLDMECGNDEDRQKLLDKYYTATPGFEVPVAEAIPYMFQKTHPYHEWQSALKALKITIMPQPDIPELDRAQGKKIEEMRSQELCFTVAGQKVFFRAIIETFATRPRRDLKTLEAVCKRASLLLKNGMLCRGRDKANPYLGLLFDHHGRMSWAETPVDLARRIFAVSLGSGGDEKGIIKDYGNQTEGNATVLTEYWQRAKAMR